jgi:hypothetical protein
VRYVVFDIILNMKNHSQICDLKEQKMKVKETKYFLFDKK